MSFRGLNDPREPGVRYEAFRGLPAGAGADELIKGIPYRGRDGYLFRDAEGVAWWVLFSGPEDAAEAETGQGDILACARLDEEATLAVRVLAPGVSRREADRAFQQSPPRTLEEATSLAASLHRVSSDT